VLGQQRVWVLKLQTNGIRAAENQTNLLDEEQKWVLKLWKTLNKFVGSIKKMGS
jgi:hypothetical protein